MCVSIHLSENGFDRLPAETTGDVLRTLGKRERCVFVFFVARRKKRYRLVVRFGRSECANRVENVRLPLLTRVDLSRPEIGDAKRVSKRFSPSGATAKIGEPVEAIACGQRTRPFSTGVSLDDKSPETSRVFARTVHFIIVIVLLSYCIV